MIIIGLSGKKNSGKDEFYNQCATFITSPICKIAFADALKEEVARACGVTVPHVELNKSIFRPMFAWWGTDFRRKQSGDDYWIKKVVEKLVALPNDMTVFITDCRFPNETKTVSDCFGVTIRIERESANVGDQHPSEIALDNYDFDYTVINDGSIADMKQRAYNIIQQINLKFIPKDHSKQAIQTTNV